MSLKEPLSRIQVLNRQRQVRINRQPIAVFCDALLRALDQPTRTLSIVFVSTREMRSLNRRYLHRNSATDVLSFCYDGVIMEGLPFLGEIIIAPAVAVEQARRSRACPEKELSRLLVHGILHLLGWDHERDRGRMYSLQKRLLRRKFCMHPHLLAQLKVNR